MQTPAPIVAAHHERLDGKGYPLGLTGRDISRDTRIITICDIYDALTGDGAAMPIAAAMAIIEGEVGATVVADCFEALKAISR